MSGPGRPTVRAELRENLLEVEITPRSYLGDNFDLYRAVTSKTSRYDRENKCQVCPLGRYPEAREDLTAAGFYVVEEYRLQRRIKDEAERRQRAKESFPRVVAAIDAIRPMFGYQKVGATFLHGRSRALLADEQGCGKTVQTLAALPEDAAAIVVCPAVARNVWVNECRHLRPDLVARRLEGPVFHAPKPGEILVVGYEDVVRRLLLREGCRTGARCIGSEGEGERCVVGTEPSEVDQTRAPTVRGYPPKAAFVFGVEACKPLEPTAPACTHLITDEAHYLKNRKSQRAKAHGRLEARAAVGWHLTGTPLPNTPDELWSVLDSIGLAREAFGSWEMFVEVFGGTFTEIRVKGGRKQKIVEWPDARLFDRKVYGQMSDEVRALLSKVMLRRTKSEVLKDLPPKRYQWIDVEVDDALDKECSRVAKAIYSAYGVDIRTVEDQEQIPLGEIAPLREKLARAKTPAAVELCEQYEACETPLVVFSAHLYPVDTISKRKGWEKIDGSVTDKKRQKIVEAFQSGELRGVACTIKAAGTALTLTRAHDLIEVDLDWVPANNAQAEGRCHRIGTTEPVLITRLRSAHPMDSHVLDVLARKTKVIEAALSS